jgi:hypothetical protein
MNPQMIEEIAALIVEGGQLAFALFLKLEPLLNIGPDEKQNIANAIAASNKADADTIARAADWMHATIEALPPAPAPPADPSKS